MGDNHTPPYPPVPRHQAGYDQTYPPAEYHSLPDQLSLPTKRPAGLPPPAITAIHPYMTEIATPHHHDQLPLPDPPATPSTLQFSTHISTPPGLDSHQFPPPSLDDPSIHIPSQPNMYNLPEPMLMPPPPNNLPPPPLPTSLEPPQPGYQQPYTAPPQPFQPSLPPPPQPHEQYPTQPPPPTSDPPPPSDAYQHPQPDSSTAFAPPIPTLPPPPPPEAAPGDVSSQAFDQMSQTQKDAYLQEWQQWEQYYAWQASQNYHQPTYQEYGTTPEYPGHQPGHTYPSALQGQAQMEQQVYPNTGYQQPYVQPGYRAQGAYGYPASEQHPGQYYRDPTNSTEVQHDQQYYTQSSLFNVQTPVEMHGTGVALEDARHAGADFHRAAAAMPVMPVMVPAKKKAVPEWLRQEMVKRQTERAKVAAETKQADDSEDEDEAEPQPAAARGGTTNRWGEDESGKGADDEGSEDEAIAEQRQRMVQSFIKKALTEILMTVTATLFDEIAREAFQETALQAADANTSSSNAGSSSDDDAGATLLGITYRDDHAASVATRKLPGCTIEAPKVDEAEPSTEQAEPQAQLQEKIENNPADNECDVCQDGAAESKVLEDSTDGAAAEVPGGDEGMEVPAPSVKQKTLRMQSMVSSATQGGEDTVKTRDRNEKGVRNRSQEKSSTSVRRKRSRSGEQQVKRRRDRKRSRSPGRSRRSRSLSHDAGRRRDRDGDRGARYDRTRSLSPGRDDKRGGGGHGRRVSPKRQRSRERRRSRSRDRGRDGRSRSRDKWGDRGGGRDKERSSNRGSWH